MFPGGEVLTVAQARARLARTFDQNGIETPALDARILVGHALGLGHAALAGASERRLTAEEVERVSALAARRVLREPIARIVEMREFWGLSLRVGPATLVPRPETETVVETALRALDAQGERSRALSIADLGTGSGALLLALLSELPGARGVGTDLDPAAVAIARDNAQRLGLADRAYFIAGDFTAAIAGPFDLVVSNPPYIRSGDIASLSPDVRDNDPHLALDGGPQGLSAYESIAADAKRLLAPAGHLVVELGAGQAQAAAALFRSAGLEVVQPARRDLAGVERALHMRAVQ